MRSFFANPILNSPYEPPRWHHALDEDGQPLDVAPIAGRRKSKLMTPVPQPRKKGKAQAPSLPFGDEVGPDSADQKYNPTPIINEIRSHLESWRALPNSADWGVTHTTARLLSHWRTHTLSEMKPFFCQIEAAEGVNNLGTFGRWDFAEFKEPCLMQAEFDALVENKLERATA